MKVIRKGKTDFFNLGKKPGEIGDKVPLLIRQGWGKGCSGVYGLAAGGGKTLSRMLGRRGGER